LSAVAERNAVAKDHGSAMPPALLQDWAELAGQTVLNATVQIARKLPLHGRPVHNLVLSNVPGPQETLSFLGCEVEVLFPFGPIVMGAGLNITVMSVDGKLGVGIISCPDLIEDVWELADAFPAAMKELLDLAP
jgi:diacylglycerol O-acyltransferase / wax synthase